MCLSNLFQGLFSGIHQPAYGAQSTGQANKVCSTPAGQKLDTKTWEQTPRNRQDVKKMYTLRRIDSRVLPFHRPDWRVMARDVSQQSLAASMMQHDATSMCVEVRGLAKSHGTTSDVEVNLCHFRLLCRVR